MASTILSDLEPGMTLIDCRVRSLSHASYHGSSNETSPTASPCVPATPTNTPASGTSSPAHPAESLSLPIPPANKPASNLDSRLVHPPLAGGAMTDEEIYSVLSERLDALALATSRKGRLPEEEMSILGEKVPKAPENEYYEIRAVPGKGYGCFAKKVIEQGTRILADDPLLIVPIAEYRLPDIEAAFQKLSLAHQALYFTLHSAHGQDPNNWPKHTHSSVEPQERCRIEEQHNARVAEKASLISVFQTNCMEMGMGAAVFPHAARFNHSCNPNACFTWNPAIRKETIHIMKDVKKNEQITLAYCDMTHDKATRRWELKHYGFFCDCSACSGDDTEPETFAAKSASRRFRLMELDRDFKYMRGPNIHIGAKQLGFMEKLLEYAQLLNEEGDFTIRLANTYLDLALICEQRDDLPNARLCSRKAVKMKLVCQGADFPDVDRYVGVAQRMQKKLDRQGGSINGRVEYWEKEQLGD